MAVRIRLSRLGKKNAPIYRIVATDSRNKRDGKFIEDLGTYNPRTGQFVQFHIERIDNWIAQGAVPSDAVRRLHKEYKKAHAERA
jgi:small subunit ribosomal protein S16